MGFPASDTGQEKFNWRSELSNLIWPVTSRRVEERVRGFAIRDPKNRFLTGAARGPTQRSAPPTGRWANRRWT